jgi:hypothetical protein
MALGLALICGAVGGFVGFALGLFIAAAGSANKEADAYTKGYMDGLKVKKGRKK